MRFKHAVLPLALALGVCGARAAETPTMTVASVADLASLFEGEFTTLPDRGGATPAPPQVLYNLAKRVRVPALGQEVVYAEQHEKAPDGPMLWQRLYAFELDHDLGLIVMKPYSFGNGQQLAGAYSDPTPLAKLEPAALKPQADGCIVLWHRSEAGFDGVLKPGSCKDAPAAPKAAAQSAAGAPAITVTKTDYTEQPQGGSQTPIVFRRIH
ncbi:MAG: hypothetical protein JWM91_4970 [Rhodospirillales bacterium]|nr:hypothetical protein [Rhodospirillales bacterium]